MYARAQQPDHPVCCQGRQMREREIYSKAKGSSEAMCQFCFLSGPIDML